MDGGNGLDLEKASGCQSQEGAHCSPAECSSSRYGAFLACCEADLSDLDHEKKISNTKAREVLGWQWRYTSEEMVVATTDTIAKFGIAKV